MIKESESSIYQKIKEINEKLDSLKNRIQILPHELLFSVFDQEFPGMRPIQNSSVLRLTLQLLNLQTPFFPKCQSLFHTVVARAELSTDLEGSCEVLSDFLSTATEQTAAGKIPKQTFQLILNKYTLNELSSEESPNRLMLLFHQLLKNYPWNDSIQFIFLALFRRVDEIPPSRRIHFFNKTIETKILQIARLFFALALSAGWKRQSPSNPVERWAQNPLFEPRLLPLIFEYSLPN